MNEPFITASSKQPVHWLLSGVTAILGLAAGIAAASFWESRSPETLTTQEIVRALGLNYWYYTVPKTDGTEFVSIELHDEEKVTRLGEGGNWRTGERLLITLRTLHDTGKLEFAVAGESARFGGVFDDPFTGTHLQLYAQNGTSVNDQPLVMANRNGILQSFPRGVRQGDVAVWVSMSEP